MHYVYVLRNMNGRFYLGMTSDLKRRLREHARGKTRSTSGQEWRLIYYEAYVSRGAALRRERALKHDGRSRRALMERIKADLGGVETE